MIIRRITGTNTYRDHWDKFRFYYVFGLKLRSTSNSAVDIIIGVINVVIKENQGLCYLLHFVIFSNVGTENPFFFFYFKKTTVP